MSLLSFILGMSTTVGALLAGWYLYRKWVVPQQLGSRSELLARSSKIWTDAYEQLGGPDGFTTLWEIQHGGMNKTLQIQITERTELRTKIEERPTIEKETSPTPERKEPPQKGEDKEEERKEPDFSN